MPRLWTFAPHTITEDLELVIHRFVNGEDDAPLEFPFQQLGEDVDRVYDLSVHEWHGLRVELSASLPSESLALVLPRDEAFQQATRLVVSLACPATKMRQAVVLAPYDRGLWRGSAVLKREALRGVITMSPKLARNVPATEGTRDGVATDAAMVIAEGAEIRLRLDESPSPFEGGLSVQWEDFRSSENSWRKAHDNDLYSLDFPAGEPILWLNERYVELQAALHEPNPTGATALLKDTAMALIAQGTLTQLFLAALGSIEKDEETGERVVPSGWQTEVVGKFLPHLFPDAATDEQRMQELFEGRESGPGSAVIATKVGSAIQASLRIDRTVAAAIRAGREA